MAAISQKPVVFRELRHSTASRNQTHRNHAQYNRACHTYPTPRNIWLHIPELVWQLLSLLPRSCNRYGNGIPLSHHSQRIPQRLALQGIVAHHEERGLSRRYARHLFRRFHNTPQIMRNIGLEVMELTNITRCISASLSCSSVVMYRFKIQTVSPCNNKAGKKE